MAQTIKLKRSNTSGSKPTTSNLALGEIALNTKDGLFFLRRYVDGTNGNDTITAYTPEYINEYSSQIDVTVTVDTKTAAHPEYNNGSSNGYLLDGIEGPFLALVPGNTYRFDQSDSSNTGHPFRFYLEANKTTAYTSGVTTNGTAGSSGAYTQIAVSTSTPQILYYQCSSHAYMGSGSYTEAGTISTSQLQADSVTTAKIAPNAITSTEIAENTVGSSEIAQNSITSVHIATGVVIEADVANNSITSSKIATNAVGSTEIAQNSILTKHIDDNQVGIDQLNVTDGTSGQALTTDGAGTLSFSTVASSLSGASDTDITTPSSGQILVHDGTDSFDNVSISGDATLSSAGVLTIATNAIESTMIAQNSILTKHIDDNQIGIDQLNVTDGTSGQVLTTDGAGTLSFSTVSGGGGSQNLFSTVAVSGQSDIVADATTDTLTVAAGSGISLTTNASTDTLTITATGSGLSANAVTSAYLASNAVLARHIATDAVGSSELAATGVSAGTYGSSTATPQFTVDTDGRITSVGNVTISSSGGGGSAGLNQVVNTYESTGDGSTVAFNTGTTITSENLTWVFIDGVYQEKGAYSTSGSTVTFSAAPPNGTSIEVLNLSSITTGGAFDHNSFSGDGSTTDFTLANTPDSETDLIVFIDGVYQNNNAFNVSGTTLSFDTAPANGTTVIAYSIGGVVTGKANLVNTFNGDSSTTAFTLSIDPKDEKNTIVFVGGVYQPKATYSISGTTLTFTEAPPTGTGNIEVSISQITTTTQLAADILDGNTFTGSTELTGELTASEFIGDLRGATLFKGQAGEALSKGEVVYISGISGNTTVVSKADADDANKMPAFGIVAADASLNASVSIYTFGRLSGLDTSSFSEGDELYVSTTAGALTSTAPAGESAAIQKIAKVTRSNASSGTIFVMGAGRSNAVSNLDDGDIFIGNASNQAVTSALSTEVESYLDGGTSTPSFASLNVTTTTTDDSVTITTTEDSSVAAPVVTLKRNSSSPADADYLGQIKFKGENDGDQEVVYAKITGKIGDNTDTTEDGIIEFANIKDGSQTITVRLKSDEMQLINSTGLNVGGTSVLSGLTYPTSDGSAGQYLQTDGSGNLSFSTISGYTDSDVETYLDGGTSTPTFSTITSEGTVLIGHTSAVPIRTINQRVQISGTDQATAGLSLARYQNGAFAPGIHFAKSRNATVGAHTIVQDGDRLGDINFYGSDGTDFSNHAATIMCEVDGTPGNDDTPGRLTFHTTADGSGAATERMRIDASGRVGIGVTPTHNFNLQSAGTVEARFRSTDADCRLQISSDTDEGQDSILEFLSGTSTRGSIAYDHNPTATSQNMLFKTGDNAVTAMRIDGSGRVGINRTPSISNSKLEISGADNVPLINFEASGATAGIGIGAQAGSSAMRFYYGTTERASLNLHGAWKVKSTSGAYFNSVSKYHEINSNDGALTTVLIRNGSTYYANCANFWLYGGAPNNTQSQFWTCNDTVGQKASIQSNGGFYNYQSNNSNLCDVREKKNIEVLGSTWNSVKSWDLKKFHYNEDADSDDKRLGVIAQEIETTNPELITEHTRVQAMDEVLWTEEDDLPEGVSIGDIKTAAQDAVVRKGVKEQQMYIMAIKALQEAMTEIESLKTRIEILENA